MSDPQRPDNEEVPAPTDDEQAPVAADAPAEAVADAEPELLADEPEVVPEPEAVPEVIEPEIVEIDPEIVADEADAADDEFVAEAHEDEDKGAPVAAAAVAGAAADKPTKAKTEKAASSVRDPKSRSEDELPYVDDRVSKWWVGLIVAVFVVIFAYGLLFGGSGALTPGSPSPSPSASPSPTPSLTASPEASASPSPSATPSASPAPSASPEPSPT